jgi:hypothetical protein
LAEKRKRVVMDVMKRQNKCVDSLNKASWTISLADWLCVASVVPVLVVSKCIFLF